MIIYQTNPTVVVRADNWVVKIFPSIDDCEEEYLRLQKGKVALIERFGDGYELKTINAVRAHQNVMVMEAASGCALKNLARSTEAVTLVGEYLAKFHREPYEIDGDSAPRMVGDFSIDHLFVDFEQKKISLIDPGGNYLVKGNQLEDLARFVFSVRERYRYRIRLSTVVIRSFFTSYMQFNQIELGELTATLDLRQKKSAQKYKLQKSSIRAHLGILSLKINRAIIRRAINC